MKTILTWFVERMKEPSSYAAAGGAVVGVGVLVDQPVVVVVGIIGGALGWLLKEKGHI